MAFKLLWRTPPGLQRRHSCRRPASFRLRHETLWRH